MASTSSEKHIVSIDEQRSVNDKMLVNGTLPPVYDEKIPTTSHQYARQPITDDKELATSSINLSRTPTPLAGKTLKFHHASFPWRSVNVTTASGQPAFYAEVSEATPKKPDVNLRAPDSNGASVGRSHFRLSRSMRVGVGSNDLDLDWYEMKSSSFFSKGTFDFAYAGRSLRLQRTHAKEDGVEGVMQKANLNHFKVADVHSGEAVAVYVSETYHPGWMKGTLTLKEGVERDLEVLVVLAVVGWREKMRRRAAYSAGGGNGGGGG